MKETELPLSINATRLYCLSSMESTCTDESSSSSLPIPRSETRAIDSRVETSSVTTAGSTKFAVGSASSDSSSLSLGNHTGDDQVSYNKNTSAHFGSLCVNVQSRHSCGTVSLSLYSCSLFFCLFQHSLPRWFASCLGSLLWFLMRAKKPSLLLMRTRFHQLISESCPGPAGPACASISIWPARISRKSPYGSTIF